MASKSNPPVVSSEPSSSELDYQTDTRQCDDALEFALKGGDTVWGEKEEKAVLFKIDLIILPLLFFCAMIGFADSGAFGFAALFGLIKDLKLYTIQMVNGEETQNTDRYSFAAAIYNLGSAAGQYPVLYVAQFFSYGKALGLTSIYGGLLAMLTLVCRNFRDVMALRFFYGFGYVTQPLIIIIAAMWWKTNEQPLRLGLAIGGAGVGSIIGTGIDFGAVEIGGVYASSPWKWIYIVFGSATMGIGLIIFLLLPSSPMKAWFLRSERERFIAVRRLAQNNTGIQTRQFKWEQLKEAAMDPQLWLLGIYAFSFSFCNNALGSFLGFLVSSFGYSQRQSLLMSMPVSAIALVSMVSSGVLGSIFPRRRILIAMLFLLPGIIGYSLLWKGDRDKKAMLLGGLYISSTFFGALVQMYALLSGNVAGHTKKSAVNATVVMLSQLGGFSGPWAYHGDEAARGYPTGQISALCLLCVSEGAFAALWLYYYVRNKKKAGFRDEHQELVGDPKMAFVDQTDQENPVFQYAT